MKHRIRINGEVKEFDGELGSGILDKNGNEIFEGDKVSLKGDPRKVSVIFKEGMFFAQYSDVQRIALITCRKDEIISE